MCEAVSFTEQHCEPSEARKRSLLQISQVLEKLDAQTLEKLSSLLSEPTKLTLFESNVEKIDSLDSHHC
jgi:vacuolar-type H+-ATPase subunit E/Vma4